MSPASDSSPDVQPGAGPESRTDPELESRVAQRTAELLSANERLRGEIDQLNRLQEELLAALAHELRTPLNAIFGWTTLLRSGRLDEATQARALETIERNARAQKQLIEDLLDVSRRSARFKARSSASTAKASK